MNALIVGSGAVLPAFRLADDQPGQTMIGTKRGLQFGKSAGRHQQVSASILGFGKQACRSMATKDTAHLYVQAISGTTDGHAHIGKIKKIY